MSRIRPMSKIGGILLFLGLLGVLVAACSGGSSSPAQATATPSAFHTALKTSDNLFLIQLSVTPNRLGLNTFTVNVEDARSGKPVTNVHVQLSATMLDMAMGTEILDLPSDGNGHYSGQGALSMAGNWEIRILLHMSDATSHVAQVHLSTQS